jgi:uncharacterized protein (DUF2384 family)
MSELTKSAATKEEIHDLADRKGIPWDNNAKFKRWSKALTGKAHLDDMTPKQLDEVKEELLKVKAHSRSIRGWRMGVRAYERKRAAKKKLKEKLAIRVAKRTNITV